MNFVSKVAVEALKCVIHQYNPLNALNMFFNHVNKTLGREGTPGKMVKLQGAEEQPCQCRFE